MNQMDCIFCTLFDSNYLDKGLVLFDSMKRCMSEFKLYVIAFDDRCYEVLTKLNYRELIPISLQEFESEELKKVKKERTRAEYCWTCSSWSIRYVLEKFKESICTYIDADMMFFSSPQFVFDKMRAQKCSTIIVPHRFATQEEERKAHDRVGSYCVEFNTFLNDKNGLEALNWWSDNCLKWCFYAKPGTTVWYGDQKYLNVFPDKFKGVMICNDLGVGLAPWNINLIEYDQTIKGIPYIKSKKNGTSQPIVIYHFENVVYLTEHIINGSTRTNSKSLKRAIYDPYIYRLIDKRIEIENQFNFKMSKAKRVVTKNLIMSFYQKYISPIRRIKHVSDLYFVRGNYEDISK
jgi:hypothetical protein